MESGERLYRRERRQNSVCKPSNEKAKRNFCAAGTTVSPPTKPAQLLLDCLESAPPSVTGDGCFEHQQTLSQTPIDIVKVIKLQAKANGRNICGNPIPVQGGGSTFLFIFNAKGTGIEIILWALDLTAITFHSPTMKIWHRNFYETSGSHPWFHEML